MFSEKNIVITVGNYGAAIALHSGGKIDKRAFFTDLDDSAKEQVSNICATEKNAPIYILLDTLDQSYKKKLYPPIKKGDLSRIVKRDLFVEGEGAVLKQFMITNSMNPSSKKAKQTGVNRWECLFITSSDSELVNKWVDFALELPNRLIGIYMSPIETFGLFKSLESNIKQRSKIKVKHNDLYCIILQNQVSGIRQIVFSKQGIVFTRVVNYDFNQPDFLEKYEHDLYSTFEYLKRLFPNLVMSELDITNILSEKALSLISKINNPELNFTNFTPNEAASKSGHGAVIDQNSEFSDFLISTIFAKKKKILKFTTPKIDVLNKFFLTLKSIYYSNLVLLVLTVGISIAVFLSQKDVLKLIDDAETKRYEANQTLASLKKDFVLKSSRASTEEDPNETPDRIIDFGKIDEALNTSNSKTFAQYYANLSFLKQIDLQLKSFSIEAKGFNNKSPSPKINNKINISGTIINKTGDIDDLFHKFDTATSEIKKSFAPSMVRYEELPRSLDFNKKYYDYPVTFTVTEGTEMTDSLMEAPLEMNNIP